MLKETVDNARIFSLDDLAEITDVLDEWALDRSELRRRHVGDDEQTMDAHSRPRFSKVELQLAFEALLVDTIESALA